MVYRKDWVQPQAGGLGFARNVKMFGRKVNLQTADLSTTGNVVGLFMIPANFVITDMIGPAIPGFGTGLQMSIGDAGSGGSARYLAATSFASAGALPAMAATGQFFRTYSDTEIQAFITTQSSAPAPGVLELYFRGFVY